MALRASDSSCFGRRFRFASLTLAACYAVASACSPGSDSAELPFDPQRGVPLDEGRPGDAPFELRLNQTTDASGADAPVYRFVFASCNDPVAHPPENQTIWNAMLGTRPDVFVWTGDIIYPDRGRAQADEAAMRRHYAALKNSEPYGKLMAQSRVLGVYDDHDYGRNNAGAEFASKTAARTTLLDFLDEPRESPRRSRAGVHAGYRFRLPAAEAPGVAGGSNTGSVVQLLLLDTRFNREAPGESADPLGVEQWAWLEGQLKRPADIRILVSSIQVLPEEHRYEKWANFPQARRRLLELLRQTWWQSESGALVLVSGDRHLGEISALPLPSDDGANGVSGFPDAMLVELTASGLTHSVPSDWKEPNRLRRGSLAAAKNFGLIEINPVSQKIRMQIRGADDELLEEVELSFKKRKIES